MPVRRAVIGANGWTGGQYSLFRVVFGLYLVVHFAALVPWAGELWSSAGVLTDGADSPTLVPLNILAWIDGPVFVTAFVAAAAVLSVVLALGWKDRIAAILIWYVLACLFGRNPLTLNPSLPFVGWMLIAHALLPAAPFGSVAARGRTDPGGGWRTHEVDGRRASRPRRRWIPVLREPIHCGVDVEQHLPRLALLPQEGP